MTNIEHYKRLEQQARGADMGALANHWREMIEREESEQARQVKAHNSALLRDYKNYNADLIEKARKQAIKREIIGILILGAMGAFIGYLITAAF